MYRQMNLACAVVLGLAAYATCQPTSVDSPSNRVEENISNVIEWPEVVLQQGKTLIKEVLKLRTQDTEKTSMMHSLSALSRQGRRMLLEKDGDDDLVGRQAAGLSVLTTTLEDLFRQGRRMFLDDGEDDLEGRQAAGLSVLTASLGNLFRPAFTALVGSLSMNLATSFTNAITASLGRRSLDIIPPETFMTTPAGRMIPVDQPFSEFKDLNSPVRLQLRAVQGLRKRPLKKRLRRQP